MAEVVGLFKMNNTDADDLIDTPTDLVPKNVEIPSVELMRIIAAAIGPEQDQMEVLGRASCEEVEFRANTQVVEIPPLLMFNKVIDAIGGGRKAVCSCRVVDESKYKCSVQFNVTEAISPNSVGDIHDIVEGEVCDSAEGAERSAVMIAVKYLGDKHSIRVVDYSSSIIQLHGIAFDWSDVADLEILLVNLIEHWGVVLHECERLSDNLEYKLVMGPNLGTLCEAGAIYASLDELVWYIMKRFREIPANAVLEVEKLRMERHNSTGSSTSNSGSRGEAECFQAVKITEKEMLDFALSSMGIGPAKYMKFRRQDRKLEGQAKLKVPCVCGGRVHLLEIVGRAVGRSRNEEIAARDVLQFLESRLKMRIVDLNYQQRLIKEVEQSRLLCIKEEILALGRHMVEYMGNMLACIDGGCAVYSGDARELFGGPLSETQLIAFEFCCRGIEGFRNKCYMEYSKSATVLQAVERSMGVREGN